MRRLSYTTDEPSGLTTFPPPLPAVTKSKKTLGIVLLVIAVISSVIQSEVVTALQAHEAYEKPYFILWFSHSCLIFFFPLQLGYFYYRHGFSLGKYRASLSRSLKGLYDLPAAKLRRLIYKLIYRATLFTIPLTTAAYMWYVAAGLTTPPRLAAAYNTTPCFAYVFEVYLLGERWTRRKSLSVLLSVLGVIVMSFLSVHQQQHGGGGGENRTAWQALAGDLCGLTSAFMTGYVDVLYKKSFVPITGTSISLANLVTSVVGLATFAVCWVPLLVFNYLGVESFVLPSLSQFGYLGTNAFFGVLYNAAFLPVIALIGPVLAAVGVMLSIPTITLTDWVIFSRTPTWGFVIGATMVMVAFWMLVTDTSGHPRHQRMAEDGKKILADGADKGEEDEALVGIEGSNGEIVQVEDDEPLSLDTRIII